MTEVVVELPHLRIFWDEGLRAVHLLWLEPTGGAPLREGLDRGLEVLRDKGAARWLADLKWLGVMTKADEAWVNEDWFGRAIRSGMRWLAVVNPESSLSTMSVREIMESAKTRERVMSDQVKAHSFETLADARAWLAECE